jgi:hypothetical protein
MDQNESMKKLHQEVSSYFRWQCEYAHHEDRMRACRRVRDLAQSAKAAGSGFAKDLSDTVEDFFGVTDDAGPNELHLAYERVEDLLCQHEAREQGIVSVSQPRVVDSVDGSNLRKSIPMKETREPLSPEGLAAIREAVVDLALDEGNVEGAEKILGMSEEAFRPGVERLVRDLLADLTGEEEDLEDEPGSEAVSTVKCPTCGIVHAGSCPE